VAHQLSFEIARDDGRATVAIAGDLDMDGALRLEPQLDALLGDPQLDLLVLDLASVDFIDSVGLSVLIETHTRAQSGGPRLEITRPSANVRRIVRLAGYEGILPLDDRSAS
jgi:anti-sigma B factor antagonist